MIFRTRFVEQKLCHAWTKKWFDGGEEIEQVHEYSAELCLCLRLSMCLKHVHFHSVTDDHEFDD